jgi:hypothetical protein
MTGSFHFTAHQIISRATPQEAASASNAVTVIFASL